MRQPPLATILIAHLIAVTSIPIMAAATERRTSQRNHALLVGCTTYPNLARSFYLKGPANDVVLMRKLLTERFDFAEHEIVTLAEADRNLANRPTRANIEREFARLAAAVGPGDRVVIFLAGHGSQQPQDNRDDPEDFEPDGLDEVFLPSDVGRWNGGQGSVQNAIVDDELRGWFARILRRGPVVWAIVDSCHSGTVLRGETGEILRRVPPAELGITQRSLQDGSQHPQARKRHSNQQREGFDSPGVPGEFAAFFATHPSESEPEMLLPIEGERRTYYGLLTYAICRAFEEIEEPVSYRELLHRVRRLYAKWQRLGPSPEMKYSPSPLGEGTIIDREVLGSKVLKGRSDILHFAPPDAPSFINAGSLHGLANGSILSVFPPAGEREAPDPIGFVHVVQAGVLKSIVEPTPFGDRSAVANPPDGGRCEVVHYDFGDLRLRIGVACLVSPSRPVSRHAHNHAVEIVRGMEVERASLIRYEDDLTQAHWIVWVAERSAELAPATGIPSQADSPYPKYPPPDWSRPAPSDNQVRTWLRENVTKIARVRNLLAIGGDKGRIATGNSEIKINVELLRYDDTDDKVGRVLPWERVQQLNVGDIVAFRVKNCGKVAIDVSAMFVDSDFGIHRVYPPYPMNNRITPGQHTSLLLRSEVTRSPSLEHLVVIAVRSDPHNSPPIDFTCLCQDSIADTRSWLGTGRGLDSPLGRLFRNAIFAEGDSRGFHARVFGDYVVRIESWRAKDQKQ